MKYFYLYRIIVLILFNHLLLISLSAQTKEEIAPLRIPLLLSGNFGELRATHFHSGVDLKTKGIVGLPVLCVKDGKVSRVKVSAVGYGNALYIEHPDGTTTVYGHLQKFNREVTEVVRRFQYAKESFEIDENLSDYQLTFRKGDTIAYSGNTGSSGGPHLHFEYRNTATEHTLNPLHYLKIRDHIAPRIRALYIYGIDQQGRVGVIRRCEVKNLGNNKCMVAKAQLPAGKIGIGLYITDAMNDSWNKLGVYRLQLRVNDREKFRLTVDSAAFDQGSLINGLKDFRPYRDRRETVYRCFGRHLSSLMGVQLEEGGAILLQQGETVELEVMAADIYGNETQLNFQLTGGTAKREKAGPVLTAGQPHWLKAGSYSLQLGEKSLFHSVDPLQQIDSAGCFITSYEEEPLYQKARLHVAGNFGEKVILCRISDKGKREALVTQRDSAGLYSFVSLLGKYTVAEDTCPPVIEYLGVIEGRIKFKIQDEFSGIQSYRGEVNGRWCLFEYDAKSKILSCRKSEPAFVRGHLNQIVLKVTDRVGNYTEKKLSLKI